ncbi:MULTISPECIES: LPS export ABC transporter periplasmic protein LptC [Fluviicola]|uniref:LPS export ABC transporter periplasmic protein LptC n=1 Tax=Fluviicola TaxID=332102 RepID=UPI003137BD03
MRHGQTFVYLCFACALVVCSCVNDLDTIKQITFKSTDPEQKTEELYVLQTEGGFPQFKLYAPLAEAYSKPEQVTKFKEGIKVEFFDDGGNQESVLTGLYGEINETKGTMRVLDSVQLYNPARKQTLYTEALYWDQKDSLIFTDKMVMIKSPTELIYGKGIRAKQDFSFYEFLEPQGRISIKK